MKIEPGSEFSVSYGDGKSAKAVAMSLKQKMEVVRLLKSLDELPGHDSYEVIYKALAMCSPEADSLIEVIDEGDAMKIVVAAMDGQAIQEDEAKK